MADVIAFKYRAFLSYSHRHRDRTWGGWLHRALEDYRIDKDLVGRETPVGPVPKTLRPIFRDRDDFSTGHSLTEQTMAALAASEFLIVICSPNAAQSSYVNEEVRSFKAIGRAERILAIIVDGEPGDVTRECFPPALRFKIAADGSIGSEREEPIAADARKRAEALHAYRDSLAIRERLANADPLNVQCQLDVLSSHWLLAWHGDDAARRWALIVSGLQELEAEHKLTAEQARWLPMAEAELAKAQAKN